MLVGYKEMPLFPGLSLSSAVVPTLLMNNRPNVPSSKSMLKPLNGSSRNPLLAFYHHSLVQNFFHATYSPVHAHTHTYTLPESKMLRLKS